jgi:hypothetical protein
MRVTKLLADKKRIMSPPLKKRMTAAPSRGRFSVRETLFFA